MIFSLFNDFITPKHYTMLLNCIIIDDSTGALFQAADAIRSVPELRMQHLFEQVHEARAWLQKNGPVDIIFTDVEMPEISGIEAVGILKPFTKWIVFTTAYKKYAFEAFEKSVDGFISKPIRPVKLIQTLDRLQQRHSKATDTLLREANVRFVKGLSGKLDSIALKDILYIESDKNYIRVHTKEDMYTVHLTLQKAYMSLHQLIAMVQISKSALIAIEHVVKVFGNYITMADGKEFTVQPNFREAFVHRLQPLSWTAKRNSSA